MNGMQQFDIRGGETNLGAAGTFIRFDSSSGKPIRIRADGQDLGQLWPDEALELGSAVSAWSIVADPSETGVVRIGFGRIGSTRQVLSRKPPVLVMQTDGAQVAGGGAAGWVSGSPANLAASASVSIVFDLGPDWDQYGVAAVGVLPMGPSSGFASVQAMGSDTGVANPARRLKDMAVSGSANSSYAVSTGSNGHTFHVRPFGRYIVVSVTNADAANAIGAAAKVSMAAYPT